MKYLMALVVIVALNGCDRDENRIDNGTSSGAADSGAAQASSPPKSETLKITYSKDDPFQASQPGKKEAASGAQAGHESKEKPGQEMKSTQEKKPNHEEHQHK